MSRSFFQSLNELIKLDQTVQVWGVVEVQNCTSSGMTQVYDCSYHIDETRFSQEINYASLGNFLEYGIQWVSCEVFVTIFM